MGVFHDMVAVVNRTDEKLMVTYDGQRMYLEPNYDAEGNRLEDVHNAIPRQCIPYALNQNVNMGTEDPLDPSRFQSLVGFPVTKKEAAAGVKIKSWNDVTFIPPNARNQSLSRVDLARFLEDDETVKEIKVRGRRTDVEAATKAPFDLRTN